MSRQTVRVLRLGIFSKRAKKLFTEAEIPWDEIAFRTVKETLEHYFADCKAGAFAIHTVDIT